MRSVRVKTWSNCIRWEDILITKTQVFFPGLYSYVNYQTHTAHIRRSSHLTLLLDRHTDPPPTHDLKCTHTLGFLDTGPSKLLCLSAPELDEEAGATSCCKFNDGILLSSCCCISPGILGRLGNSC